MMNLPFGTVGEAAKELRSAHFQGFKAIPYQRYEADSSDIWWLLPEPANPAFHLGKIELAADKEDAGSVLVGFCVEKGYGSEMASQRSSEILKPDWFWHDFLSHCNAPLAGKVEQANEAIGGGVQISVYAGLPSKPPSKLVFNTQDRVLSRVEYTPQDDLLDGVAEAKTFADFADQMRLVDGKPSDWHWIGVIVGTAFTFNLQGRDDLSRCAAMLDPFRDWMRAARKG